MNRNAATKLSGLLVQQLGPRLFSYGTGMGRASAISRPIGIEALKFSTMSEKEEEKSAAPPSAENLESAKGKGFVSYWGVEPKQLTKEDGTPWKWSCFKILNLNAWRVNKGVTEFNSDWPNWCTTTVGTGS